VAHAVVSVLLLTKNAGPRLERVLSALLGQEGVDFEILAIDSGSSDGTTSLLERANVEVHRIPASAFSHPGTRNRIASLARGSLLAYLTQDAVPLSSRWLAELVHALEDPKVAGAFGSQVPPRGARESEVYFQRHMYPDEPRRITLPPGRRYSIGEHFFSNVNSLIRRSVWQQIPFNPEVVMSEDQWWARDVLRAGHELAYVPAAAVEHSNDFGPTALFKRNFDSGASLRGLEEGSALRSAGWFMTYLGGECRFLARHRKPLAIPGALTREAIRAAGMFAGANAAHIPRPARVRLSMHSYYWT
jgi:rhamnosyltransferase